MADETKAPPREVVNAFEDSLLAAGRTRIERPALRQLWEDADSAWAGTSSTRARLYQALLEVESNGTIELPARAGRLWDAAFPPLPARIVIPANRRPIQRLDPATEPWVPEMFWAPAWIRTARPPQRLRLDAVSINRWLLSNLGQPAVHVGREERSLHIFDDEKKLAVLAGGALFDEGRLTLETLSCEAPLGALRIGRVRDRGPVLVVENKATFDSAWRALRGCDRLGYAAVVFGGGDAVSTLVPDLADLNNLVGIEATSYEYAGDVDVAGIEAAELFATTARRAGLTARMAAALWKAVAESRPVGEDLTADPSRTQSAVDAATRLALPDAVLVRLGDGVRVPQERVDRSALADTSWWTPIGAE